MGKVKVGRGQGGGAGARGGVKKEGRGGDRRGGGVVGEER